MPLDRNIASKIRVYRSGELVCEAEAMPGESLHRHIGAAGIYLDSPCGGKGKCGKCLVTLDPAGEKVLACQTIIVGDMDVYLPDETEMEIAGANTAKPQNSEFGIRNAEKAEQSAWADEYQRMAKNPLVCHSEHSEESFPLAIQRLKDPSVALLPQDDTFSAILDFPPPLVDEARLGVAVDIGTTTVVAHLTDLKTGKRIATASGTNAQRTYGADVISRIQFCADNGHETLTRLIREQLSSLIQDTCKASGAGASDIGYIVIAANTIMEHLAAGLSPVGMGTVPFTPVSLFGGETAAGNDLPVSPAAKTYFAPAISAYVGGDITAGILAAKLEDTTGPVVYIDIGTNGEIVLKLDDKYYCCATAAGPAFEGAEITMGMAAVKGAINHVKWVNDSLSISVIGDGAPVGLCGSGLLDALAVLLETGAVDETGRLLDAGEIDHEISAYIGKSDGKNIFRLPAGGTSGGSGSGDSNSGHGHTAESDVVCNAPFESDVVCNAPFESDAVRKVPFESETVYMTAGDIRKLQLAKSAIAAGIQTLLQYAGITEDQVRLFVLAGGFGSFMDQYSAARIGLFPRCFLPVSQTLGNTAGEGAAIALCSADARERLGDIRARCEYVELSTSPVFNEQFVEQMMFPCY